MFFDIHAHAYRRPGPPQDGHTVFANPKEVIKRYDGLDIDAGALLPLIGPETYLPQSNEDILDMAAESGGRFIPFCNIDPRGISNSPDAPLDIWLRHYKKAGCKGIGEVMPNLPFRDHLVHNLFGHCEKIGFPLIFDISHKIGGGYGLYDDPGLPQLEECLQRFPKLKILGHGPPFWAEIGALETPLDRSEYPKYPVREEGVVPKLLRRYPNMLGDLSAGSGFNALSRDPDYAVKFLNEFQDKLLFGTDICGAAQDLPLAGFLLGLRARRKISRTVFNKIARENALKLLNL
jgi:predicted TIM-barrel fold metal-dependent hydrolase